MKHTDIREIFAHTEAYLNGTVTVCGWVRTARDSKSVSFLEINDGTCFRNLQIVVDKTRIPEDMVRDAMAVGASVCAVGSAGLTPAAYSRTRICPCSGSGSGMSVRRKTSGPPNAVMTIARITILPQSVSYMGISVAPIIVT